MFSRQWCCNKSLALNIYSLAAQQQINSNKKKNVMWFQLSVFSSLDKSTSTGVYLFLLPYIFFFAQFFYSLISFFVVLFFFAFRRNGICWMWTPGNTCLLWIKLKLKTKKLGDQKRESECGWRCKKKYITQMKVCMLLWQMFKRPKNTVFHIINDRIEINRRKTQRHTNTYIFIQREKKIAGNICNRKYRNVPMVC